MKNKLWIGAIPIMVLALIMCTSKQEVQSQSNSLPHKTLIARIGECTYWEIRRSGTHNVYITHCASSRTSENATIASH